MAARNQELTKTDNYEYLKNVIVKYMMTGDEVRNGGTSMRTQTSKAAGGVGLSIVPCPRSSSVASLSVFLQSLIAVLATLLRLSPEELENIRKKRASNKGGLFGLF